MICTTRQILFRFSKQKERHRQATKKVEEQEKTYSFFFLVGKSKGSRQLGNLGVDGRYY